ncbi:MAG: ABC transporter ATP-binding protein, partial [Salinisphaera sp.]|nr:ABC transporter ATP-binding protein [Salinisphaera sp.]
MTEPNKPAILRVHELRTWLDTPQGVVRAVNSVSFTLERGRTLALLGESGCGKSMTALSLMRLVPEPAGHIVGGAVELDGTDLLDLPEHAMRRLRGRRLAMIFQEPMSALNPVLTVGDQIGEALRRHFGLRGKRRRERCLALLREVGLPDPEARLDAYPHQLSGGMKQRVGIAIALAGEPEVLIADEPTTALDVTVQAQILALLARLQRDRGMAMLLITHDLAVVRQVADRVAVMYAGHIVEQASREALFAQPQHPYTRALFASVPDRQRRRQRLTVIRGSVPSLARQFQACRFADRCEHAWDDCRNTAPAWIDTDSGRVRCHLYDRRIAKQPPVQTPAVADTAAEPDTHPVGNGQALLEARDVKVHFPIKRGVLKRTVGHVFAVDGVSLQVTPGRTLALVGESGCGKTTLGLALLQLLRPSAGSVHFDGVDLARLRRHALRRKRRELQMIFQDPYSSMDPRMRIADVVIEGMRAQGIGGGVKQRRKRAAELLEEVGLDAAALDRYPHEFSGGQRQRVCIARALAVDPRLIICDEPTSALDVSVQAQVLNLLRRLQGEYALAYLFISHNMAVVGYIADEVAVMYLGRVVEQGPVDEVMQRP